MKPLLRGILHSFKTLSLGRFRDPSVRASMARIKHSVTSSDASLLKLSSMGAVFTGATAAQRASSLGIFHCQWIQQVVKVSVPDLFHLQR